MAKSEHAAKVPAADQTLRILRFLSTQRGPVPAALIAKTLDIPRSSIYHLLAVLQEHGFVLHLPEARRYGLGVAAFELSGGFSHQEPLSRIGQPLLAGLVDRIGESGHLAVVQGAGGISVVGVMADIGSALTAGHFLRDRNAGPEIGRAHV